MHTLLVDVHEMLDDYAAQHLLDGRGAGIRDRITALLTHERDLERRLQNAAEHATLGDMTINKVREEVKG